MLSGTDLLALPHHHEEMTSRFLFITDLETHSKIS